MPIHGHHILELLSAAERNHGHVRFVTPRGTQEASFADMWSLSSRMAHALEMSVPNGRVAGILTPSVEMVACLVACLRAGRDFASVPLPGRGQDSASYLQQLETVADLAHIGAMVVEAAYFDLLQPFAARRKCSVIMAESLAEATSTELRSDNEPGELIQFSSGTTGMPKGVRLAGAAIAASVEATLDALSIDDDPEVFCSWVPMSHNTGLIGGLLGSWVGCTRTRPGYRHICISPELFLTRPSIWMESCAANGATITAAPTFAYQVAARDLSRSATMNLIKLRAAIIGAEPIGQETLQAFASSGSRHGLREIALCPAYGLAEATLVVSMVRPEEPWTTKVVSVDGQTKAYVSCGRTLHCVNVEAPDASTGVGPIKIAGPALCSGYIPARDIPPHDSLDTGDLGAFAERELCVTGRSDDLLCIAGRNIFAWELERAGSLQHLGVGDCVVVADGRGRYIALFESATEDGNPGDALSEIRRSLVAIAGIGPSAVGCLGRGALPRTPSGKIRRNRVASDVSRFVESCHTYREF